MAVETPRPMFDTDELVINMGPQHPSTHGVLRVIRQLNLANTGNRLLNLSATRSHS